jgi:phospholipid transport system substrate-binding protein
MFKKILLICIISIVSTYAVEEQNIKQVMDTKIKHVLTVLKNKNLSTTQKEKKSIAIMDSVFHYPTMAKISLGKYWKRLSKKEKKAFTKVFEQKMKHSYVDKLRLYHNQKVVTKNLKKIKKNRITLETYIIGNAETYKIIYSFFKKKNSKQWFIYDVRLAGVSIIQTYRKQFKAFLKTKTFKQLLNSL